jgi:hypothetical protein
VTTIILPSLLRSWAQHAHSRSITATTVPWWLDPNARVDSVVRAAQALGWVARNTLDSGDPEGWDIHIVVDPNTSVVIRLVGATVPIDEPTAPSETIADAWRVLALTAPPPREAIAFHLVCVEPYLLRADECTTAKMALDAWLAVGPWSAASDAEAWASAPAPFPRNAARVVFPGIGLIACTVVA